MIPLGENTLYRQILLVLNRRLSDYRINKPVSGSTRRREMYMLFRALHMCLYPPRIIRKDTEQSGRKVVANPILDRPLVDQRLRLYREISQIFSVHNLVLRSLYLRSKSLSIRDVICSFPNAAAIVLSIFS